MSGNPSPLRCPNCQQLLNAGTEQCPNCHAKIQAHTTIIADVTSLSPGSGSHGGPVSTQRENSGIAPTSDQSHVPVSRTPTSPILPGGKPSQERSGSPGSSPSPLPPALPSPVSVEPARQGPIVVLSLRTALVVVAVVVVVVAAVSAGVATVITKSGQQTLTSASTATATATNVVEATSTPAPVPTTETTPTSVSSTTGLPCVVNVGTWSGSADWKNLNGALINDGTNPNGIYNRYYGGPTIVAPCKLGNLSDYAVEAKVQVISYNYNPCFAITVRGSSSPDGWQGYNGMVGGCGSVMNGLDIYGRGTQDVNAPFDQGTSEHTYRVEVNGNQVLFYVDGNLELTLTDNHYLTGSQVGLWCSGVQLQVTSFEVTTL
jgi:hypothetical protein